MKDKIFNYIKAVRKKWRVLNAIYKTAVKLAKEGSTLEALSLLERYEKVRKNVWGIKKKQNELRRF